MSEEDDEAEDLRGALVMDRTGTPCGHALRLLRDRRTGALVFVSIRDGLLGRRRHLIPLAEAEIGYERIDVPYSRARVMDSPHCLSDPSASRRTTPSLSGSESAASTAVRGTSARSG